MLPALIVHPFQVSEVPQCLDCSVDGSLADLLPGQKGDCGRDGKPGRIFLKKSPYGFALRGKAETRPVELPSQFFLRQNRIDIHS